MKRGERGRVSGLGGWRLGWARPWRFIASCKFGAVAVGRGRGGEGEEGEREGGKGRGKRGGQGEEGWGLGEDEESRADGLAACRYYEGGVSSVYFWDLDDGFAGVVLLKKSTSRPPPPFGCSSMLG